MIVKKEWLHGVKMLCGHSFFQSLHNEEIPRSVKIRYIFLNLPISFFIFLNDSAAEGIYKFF